MSHRLFVGLRPPREIRAALIDTLHGIDNARWQDDGQLHLTLRFVGEVESHRADDLAEALGRIAFEAFDLAIASVGIFKRKSVARTLWAGIEPSEPLTRLQRKVERCCQSIGLPAETRRFQPHVTLARLNSASGSPAPWLTRNGGLKLGPWPVRQFVLFESTLHPEGSRYDPVLRYPASR